MRLAPAKEFAEKIGSPFVGLSRVVGSSSRDAEPRHRLRQRVGVDCSEGGIYLNGLAVEVGPHLLRSLLHGSDSRDEVGHELWGLVEEGIEVGLSGFAFPSFVSWHRSLDLRKSGRVMSVSGFWVVGLEGDSEES